MKNHGLDKETLDLTLGAIKEFAAGRLADEKLIELDEKDEFPVEIVREMCTGLGIQLLFIPEEFGGMGGGAFDVYRVCEQMARIDLGIATGVHYPAMHLFALYRALGWHEGQFPQAERIGRSIVTLPLFPAMSDDDVTRVCEAAREALA